MTSLQNMGYGSETLDIYMPSSRTEGVYTTRVSSDVPCALPPPTRYTLHGRIHACNLKTLCAARLEASLLPCTRQVVELAGCWMWRTASYMDIVFCCLVEPGLLMHGRTMT